MDVNKNGVISREDFEVMGKRLAECSSMTKRQAESICMEFAKLADALHFEPGIKVPLTEAAQQVSKAYLIKTPAERKAIVHRTHKMLFDILDSNDDGYISLEEFKAYIHTAAPGTSEAEVVDSFNKIDANKIGEISREEFLAAAEDFLLGVEETELSKVFFGQLMD